MLQDLMQIKANPLCVLHSRWSGYSQCLTDGVNCETVSMSHSITDVYTFISFFHSFWPLIFSFLIILQTVGLLGRVISSSQGLYLNARQHKHILNIHALYGIRNYDPSFRAREDSSCLIPVFCNLQRLL
jgi:hypothetical protein